MVTSLYRSDGFTGWQRFCSFRVGIPAQPLGKLAQRSIARTFVSSFKWAIWSISGNEFLISTVDSFCELRFFGLVGRRFGPDSFVGDVLGYPIEGRILSLNPIGRVRRVTHPWDGLD